MKVLMFGWEYPPHVYGGLATANFGISEGLHAQGDVETILCLPHPFGDEDHTYAEIVAMNHVPIAYRELGYDYVKSRLGNIMSPELYYKLREHILCRLQLYERQRPWCNGFCRRLSFKSARGD